MPRTPATPSPLVGLACRCAPDARARHVAASAAKEGKVTYVPQPRVEDGDGGCFSSAANKGSMYASNHVSAQTSTVTVIEIKVPHRFFGGDVRQAYRNTVFSLRADGISPEDFDGRPLKKAFIDFSKETEFQSW